MVQYTPDIHRAGYSNTCTIDTDVFADPVLVLVHKALTDTKQDTICSTPLVTVFRDGE